MKQQRPVYSTSWYKEYPKKEYVPSFIPSIKQKVANTFFDDSHPLTQYKKACKKLRTLGEAMEKGKISYIHKGKFVFKQKYSVTGA